MARVDRNDPEGAFGIHTADQGEIAVGCSIPLPAKVSRFRGGGGPTCMGIAF